MTPRNRLQIRPPALTLPALVALAILFGGFDNGFGYGLLYLSAAPLLIWQWLTCPPDRKFIRAGVPVIALLAVAGLWAAFASLSFTGGGGSLSPDLLMHELVGLAAYACVFLLAGSFGRTSRDPDRMIDWLNGFGLAVMIVGLLINYGPFEGLAQYWQAGGGRFVGTLNNANVAGAFSGTLAVLALGRLFDRGSRRTYRLARSEALAFNVLDLSVLAVGFASVLLTAGRFVTVATVAGLAVVGFSAWRRGRLTARNALPACLVVAAVGFAQLTYRLLQRVELLEVHAVERGKLWSHYWEIASQSPWIGYGMGTFPMLHERYLRPLSFARENWTVNSPHNIVIHLLLQAGWPYLMLIAVACIAVGLQIFRRWRPSVTGLSMAVAGVLLLLCGMVDIALEVPAIVALFLMLAGILWGRRLRPRRTAA
jgi:O-antigen ligase